MSTIQNTKNTANKWNPNGVNKVHLLNEALSRVRMRRPQSVGHPTTEAPRSARQVAMAARREAARQLGSR
jgi:hypothetical protein